MNPQQLWSVAGSLAGVFVIVVGAFAYHMETRFKAMDKRFDDLYRYLELIKKDLDERLDLMKRGFDVRLEMVEHRLDRLEKVTK